MDSILETPLDYQLTRIKTEAATGYFDCTPVAKVDFDTVLSWCRGNPNDEFMRKHILRMMATWQPETLRQKILAADSNDMFLRALYFEACLLFAPFNRLSKHFPEKIRRRLAHESPLIFIKAHQCKDHRLHRRWIELLRPNFIEHMPLPAQEKAALPAPAAKDVVEHAMTAEAPLPSLTETLPRKSTKSQDAVLDPELLANKALDRLTKAGVNVGPEMRHEASLSPIALLRNWQLALSVDCGRHNYRINGEQTSFGRGLDLKDARVACVMEVVERVSSYATISKDVVKGYRQSYPLKHASFRELNSVGLCPLDPNGLGLEAPYEDEPLYWIEGHAAGDMKTVMVPAQCVFLFCNLDEIKLFSGLGSTGLGAGATLAQAKCKALLEIIERDSASVVPYTPELCFEVETMDPQVSRLLRSYAERGIHVGFIDITGPLGLPCCKVFVKDIDGTIAAGTGAHLNARKALLSALTETTYPYPHGDPSQPLAPANVRVPLEALPDFDRGSAEENLHLLEQLLLSNGFQPIYVDLTRSDLDLPVVRAFVPGMALMADFDTFSRVHPRLYGHYLKYARKQ